MPATLGDHLRALTIHHEFPTGSFCKLPYTRIFYVYFVEAENGYVKIGCTQNLKSRIKSIRSHSPMEIKLIGKIKGGYDLEATLHRRFKKYRKHGEWFEGAPELLEYIETHKIYKGKSLG